METQISVPIATTQFLQVVDFLRAQDSDYDPVLVIRNAIDYWLENAGWKPELLPPHGESRGYTWKNLFLPHGTDIRMKYRGAYQYAKVQGDEIIFQGQPTTPGKLANAIAGSSRNAWRDLWIKRPEDETWTLADALRPETQAMASDLLEELGESRGEES